MKKSDRGAVWTTPNYIERERFIAIARELQKAVIKQIVCGLLSKAKENATILRRRKTRFAPVNSSAT